MASEICPRTSSSLKRSSPSRRGFLPLPPIMASPIDTPSSSLSSEAPPALQLPDDSTGASGSMSMNRVSVQVVVSAPTWTSTPPTPPTKITRHSSAYLPLEPTSPFSPLASFSASMHTHARPNRQAPRLKKCISVPNVLGRSRTVSGPPRPGDDTPSLSAPPFLAKTTMGRVVGSVDLTSACPKAIFHLSNATTDNEDEGYSAESRPRSISDVNSPDGSWSDHTSDDVWEREKGKDTLRKFHALKELLLTENGYLTDLRAFVTVYLRNLPTLVTRTTTFGRASASFNSGTWVPSYTHLQAASLATSATTDGCTAPLSASAVKEAPRPNIRYLFTDSELELITRNAEDILQLHERFVRELREALESLGFVVQDDLHSQPTAEHLDNLESAVRAVSAKFATEASRFNAYQFFCAGHPEAVDLVRRVSHQHPVEWEAFELRCSTMVSDIIEGGKMAESEPKQGLRPAQEDRTRAMSLTSLDSAVRTLRLRCPSTRDAAQSLDIKREITGHRISFMDYLIKPVQRICKYPLLFDQVLSGKTLRGIVSNDTDSRPHVDVIVKSAAQAMRHVASSVDEARHRQDAAIQTSLITSRMFLGIQTLAAVTDTTVQGLTAEFLSSLGTCLLAGSLDVMHHHPLQPLDSSSNFKAKYFGAFLYMGGYLILVKVMKGRRYEPRHWFSLAEFTISGLDEEGALLPHSIRASCCDQHFELAASCQREKDVWLAAIQSSIGEKPIWANEPTPSFKVDEKGGLISSLDSEAELISGLPTILSIPELPNNNSDAELSETFFPFLRAPSRTKNKRRRPNMTPRSESSPTTASRRSSTTSVKAIFGPLSDAESIVIRRSSPIARQQVDQALQDVTSQECLTARTYGFSRDAELFRSGSTTLCRTKSRLSKHESIRVPRSRTSDGLDSTIARSASQNLAARRNAKKLSISSAPPILDEKKFITRTPTSASTPSTYSPPSSQPSSVPPLFASHTSSSTSSATLLDSTPATPKSLKSSRSIVRGVKDLFLLRPGHHHTSSLNSNSQPPPPLENPAAAPSCIRWTMGRRPRTAPEVRGDRMARLSNRFSSTLKVQPNVAAV